MNAIAPLIPQLCFVAVFAVVGFAQSTATPSVVFATGQGGGISSSGAVTGSPYSAEQFAERVQTLADGTHITQAPQKTMLYRDSEGRTRMERIFTTSTRAVAVTGASFIEINDPVAGCRYVLDSNAHVARRFPSSRNMHRSSTTPPVFQSGVAGIRGNKTFTFKENAGPSASSGQPHPEISDEALGTQTMEGLTAEGHRITIVYPESYMGNDRPITTVRETWMSPELNMPISTKISDPRTGESTTKLTNISRAEPDPALFQVPAGYSVVEEQQ